MEDTDRPKLLWTPPESFINSSNLSDYIHWLYENYKLKFDNYHSLWTWSTENIAAFWKTLWNYFKIISYSDFERVVSNDPMPKTRWFEGSSLNYAEHIFRNNSSANPAIIFKSETRPMEEISWHVLEKSTSSFKKYLIGEGVKKGDRVVAYLPLIPEATMAFLAVNSMGAVWSSCSPDFGTSAVIDRFAQIEPKIMIAVDGYNYGGKPFDKLKVLKEIQQALPTVEKLVLIPYLKTNSSSLNLQNVIFWDEIMELTAGELTFEEVPFDHPLWVLYSSGTTGIPKAITHCHGGVLLEHLKYLSFHNDVKPNEKCFWYTTTGWMMWNYIQSSLLCGGTMVLYDGSPSYPNINVLWEFVQEAGIHHFGTSAGYIVANLKANTHPGQDYDLSSLRSIGSTGSPLPPEGFDWIYKEVKSDLWLTSMSGGTDICSAFVGGNPLWPVYSGQIQCRALGCKLESLDESGKQVYDEVGEMVISKPMPSMPIYFWNDNNYQKYQESYFYNYPGKWRHGDWIKITPKNGVIIYGRSDSTLNRAGIRIGTSEIYRAIDKIPEVKDSLILCLEQSGGEFYMPLFVVMDKEISLDKEMISKIKTVIRNENTPRHVPDEIIEINEIPYTISGKKVETPVKKILMGTPKEEIINPDSLKNPESLDFFTELSKKIKI